MLIKTKLKWASKCGRLEHKMGRWLFVPVVAMPAWGYYKNDFVGMCIGILAFVFWATYLFSHTLEKKLYQSAKFDFRGKH